MTCLIIIAHLFVCCVLARRQPLGLKSEAQEEVSNTAAPPMALLRLAPKARQTPWSCRLKCPTLQLNQTWLQPGTIKALGFLFMETVQEVIFLIKLTCFNYIKAFIF